MEFTTLHFTDYPSITVPKSLQLVYPTESSLPKNMHHFLLSIPWEDDYILLVPKKYRWFFMAVLPHLRARTTDVHTAHCCMYIDPLCAAIERELHCDPLNKKVVTLSLILHDCGWSVLSEAEVAASLGVTGLTLTKEALEPKEKHAVEGVALAKKLLEKYAEELSLSENEVNLILTAIRHHDQPEKVAKKGLGVPPEIQALVDLDHLWSFTQANFWQDVYRKGINSPKTYLENLEEDLNDYFVTQSGKDLAQQLLRDREKEVLEFLQHV